MPLCLLLLQSMERKNRLIDKKNRNKGRQNKPIEPKMSRRIATQNYKLREAVVQAKNQCRDHRKHKFFFTKFVHYSNQKTN